MVVSSWKMSYKWWIFQHAMFNETRGYLHFFCCFSPSQVDQTKNTTDHWKHQAAAVVSEKQLVAAWNTVGTFRRARRAEEDDWKWWSNHVCTRTWRCLDIFSFVFFIGWKWWSKFMSMRVFSSNMTNSEGWMGGLITKKWKLCRPSKLVKHAGLSNIVFRI